MRGKDGGEIHFRRTLPTPPIEVTRYGLVSEKLFHSIPIWHKMSQNSIEIVSNLEQSVEEAKRAFLQLIDKQDLILKSSPGTRLAFIIGMTTIRKETEMKDELKNIETLEEVCGWGMMQTPGVYLFSRDGQQVDEIGRSDINIGADLRNRLFELRRKYNFYYIKPAYSSLEAFLFHCQFHHRYNCGAHPEPSQNQNWGCPVLGCAWEERRKARSTGLISRKPAVITI